MTATIAAPPAKELATPFSLTATVVTRVAQETSKSKQQHKLRGAHHAPLFLFLVARLAKRRTANPWKCNGKAIAAGGEEQNGERSDPVV